MEKGSRIAEFLDNKTLLLTGATGFLAKVMIEKILRAQPNVKKLHLLLRAPDPISALHRFDTQILGKELFERVKETHGEEYIKSKVEVAGGDITHPQMGLHTSTLERLYQELDVVINFAATTQFDERYDVALGINTIGATNVLNFSKKCTKLRAFLHVSTAYVCGDREGIVMETPFEMGDSLNGVSGLDIQKEQQLVDDTLHTLEANHASQLDIEAAMKHLGHKRARKYGWPNTYSFTKAMGEMLLGELRDGVPLVIIRPTIITSTYKEPFPGWVEGIRNIDSFVVGYGKGKMTCFPGDPHSVIDLIPVDMVVNAMITAMVVHANEPTDMIIYHVGSSKSNPIKYRRLQLLGLCYFTEWPWIDKDKNPVIVRKGKELATIDAVQRYMEIHYVIPLKILSFINVASCRYFEEMYLNLSQKVKLLMRLVELFSPYVFFKGVFDDTNTKKLRMIAVEKWGNIEMEMFYFDPMRIDWADYFMHAHIAGVVKYAFKR